MDIKLESLIEKIKKEGIEQAELEAKSILEKAKTKEKEIIESANKQAARIVEESKKEVESLQKNGETSLKQAARNVVLLVKEELTLIFDKILKQELESSLTPEFLGQILTKIIQEWSQQQDKNLEILVSPEDKDKLGQLLLAKFKEKAEKSEIKISQSIRKGFQVGIKGQDIYYDFSDEGLVEALATFLNPFLTALITDKKDG